MINLKLKAVTIRSKIDKTLFSLYTINTIFKITSFLSREDISNNEYKTSHYRRYDGICRYT
ncbi:hypothetical protein GCM10008013_44400 [Paenibacillus segetis]|uniref:Uncharacterized protein n=1 Tax=Paenibacillus segetis TaxID=1325360 RepID=A0ABQ1YUJ8_9BACL|nr:hypothetical protein GCM10008013_44400 [Paenibacillus segetis]